MRGLEIRSPLASWPAPGFPFRRTLRRPIEDEPSARQAAGPSAEPPDSIRNADAPARIRPGPATARPPPQTLTRQQHQPEDPPRPDPQPRHGHLPGRPTPLQVPTPLPVQWLGTPRTYQGPDSLDKCLDNRDCILPRGLWSTHDDPDRQPGSGVRSGLHADLDPSRTPGGAGGLSRPMADPDFLSERLLPDLPDGADRAEPAVRRIRRRRVRPAGDQLRLGGVARALDRDAAVAGAAWAA